MTKNKKIDILIEDNKRLSSENQHYKKTDNQELAQEMQTQIEDYLEINKKIMKLYKQINYKKWYGSFLSVKYHYLRLKIKLKRMFKL